MRYKITPDHIEQWVARHFPNYKKRGKGHQIKINNPFDGDTGYHFWISLEETSSKKNSEKNYYVHDWRYATYNMVFTTFVKRYLKVTYFEAIRDIIGGNASSLRSLLRRTRDTQQDDVIENEIDENIKLPPLSKLIDNSDDKIKKMALQYLSGRMISEQQAIDNSLYYTPSTIVFPYIEYGIMAYWQERSFLEKRFNFPDERTTGLSKTDFLFNFDNVEQPGGCVVIVESIINCINVGEGCVASGGASMSSSSKQIKKLKALEPRMIVLAPDFDKAGIFSVLDNFSILRKEINCQYAYCLPPKSGVDWNDMEKSGGFETARKYILSNSRPLDLRSAILLRERVRVINTFGIMETG